MQGLTKVVVLKANGTQEELSVDMTPAEKACHKIIGSDHLTFLGCICKGSVVMLVRKGIFHPFCYSLSCVVQMATLSLSSLVQTNQDRKKRGTNTP